MASFEANNQTNNSLQESSILIVDDEIEVARALKRALRPLSRDIKLANSALEALNCFNDQYFDLVISDIQMPEISGAELLVRIANQSPSVVCVAISGGCDNSEIIKAINEGKIAHFFAKPWDDTQLRLVISNLLKNRLLQIEKERLECIVLAKTKELESLANTDFLTDLANRRAFDRCLANEVRRAARNNEALTLLMCDIDNFKSYNDQLGHVAGDRCLREVAAIIKKVFQRAGDFPARYGGEEFAVILPATPLNQETINIAEGLRLAVLEAAIPHPKSDISQYVTISIGVAGQTILVEDSPNEMILRADKALYEAKQNGRNQVCFSQA